MISAKTSTLDDSPKTKQETVNLESIPNAANEVLDALKRTGYLAENVNAIRKETSGTSRPNRSPELHDKIWKKLGFKLTVLAIIVRIVHIFKLGYLFGEVRKE